jgi:hypothetical protein
MKKPRVSFRHFSGSGPVSVYWHDGPYGDAIEATKGRGVAWLASNGQLLGVEFDDVEWTSDAQTLHLSNGDTVSLHVRRGKVEVTHKPARPRNRAA